MIIKRKLFAIAVASAVLYFAEIIILGALESGYSHIRQFASELGMADAAHPRIFSAWVLVEAALFLVAGWYFYQSTNQLTGRSRISAAIGLFVAFFGVSNVFVALFPLPDPLHGGFGIGLLTLFAPWLLAWAFWRTPGVRAVCYLQLLTTPILILLGVLPQLGVFESINESNQGLFQRFGAIAFFGWLVLTSYWLDASKSDRSNFAQSNI